MKEKLSWRDAFFASPGPRSWASFLKLFSKGLSMGSADIVPGVSGGTIAFITGIYEQLIDAIKSFDFEFIGLLLKFKIKEALAHIHIRFLFTVFLGIAIALVSLARLMSYSLTKYPEYTWSLFLGLILASIILIFSKLNNITIGGIIGFVFGAVSAYFIVGLIPFTTPENYLFIFISGIIAISAMILPGISGAFILLLLSKYEFMIHALKNPFILDNQIIIVFFISGCFVGIISFSRVFAYLFARHYDFAISILVGLVVGSLRKIWPWKELVEAELINDKIHIISQRNILPSFDKIFFIEFFIIFVAFFFVLILNKRTNKQTRDV